MKQKTAEQMRPLVELFAQYEGGKKAFCAEHDLTIATLDYWRRKLAGPTRRASAFIALEVESEDNEDGCIEVYYPNGVRVVLPMGCPKELLQTVLSYR